MSDGNCLFNDLDPSLRPYLQNVYQDLKLGLCKSKVDVERHGHENQFKLVLPYCSKKLKWEIIFDLSTPWFAPDFRFEDEQFLNSSEEDLDTKLPSLAQWDESNPESLSKVIQELINQYKVYQVKKLSEDESSRAYIEYSSLLSDKLTTESDIEVWVGLHVVEFMIKLNVDVDRLPELYNNGFEENPGVDSALLLVRYPSSTNAELILSPLLTKAIGTVNLPTMHQSGALMDYVPLVTDMLNKRIQAVLTNDRIKRSLLSQMIVKYGGAVLEHDASTAAFLFDTNCFHWILQLDIDVNFPEKAPVLTIRSVYHSSKGKPRVKVLSNCPYNNFEKYIENQIDIFRNECTGLPVNNIES